MRVALYARVSTEAQEARGTIGSQLEVLRNRAAQDRNEAVAEFVDDGYSGARLDRPGLDALRDAAEAGLFEAVLCLTPDRLARAYAYQFLILEELNRLGVRVLFTDAPALDDDPQMRLLTQMQGVIAEYERAKIAERYRRGKLYRARSGEAIFNKVPYGYRRIPRSAAVPAHLEIFEPEAEVVRRIFDDYVSGGYSIRQLIKQLHADGVLSPGGRRFWPHSTLSCLLRNRAYVGSLVYYRKEEVPAPDLGRHATRRRPRPEEDWIAIPVPATVSEDIFEAAQRVSRDNSRWSPRHLRTEAWLLRGLVTCGHCGVSTTCQQLRGSRDHRFHRYYRCRFRDPLAAGGEERRCPERHIRADELDAFVFDQVKLVLLQPEQLLAGETCLANRTPVPDDELLAAQLARLARKSDLAEEERRRLIDIYQAGLIDIDELQRRTRDVDARRRQLVTQRETLVDQSRELARENQLRKRISTFASRVREGLDALDFTQRQRLIRLLVEEVRVTGWQVEIRLRIPLDEPPGSELPPGRKRGRKPGKSEASSSVRLRSPSN